MVWKRTAGAPAAGTTAPAPATGAPPPPTGGSPTPAPAGLPPVTPPAPPQPAATPPAPAATAPAGEPASRRRRTAAPAATAVAPAVPPAASVSPGAVVTAQAQPVINAPPRLPGFLAALTPKTTGPSSLRAIIEGRTAAGEPNLFPTVYLVGGEAGGMLQYHDMNVEGANADLPTGVDPLPIILLGVRYELIMWPKGYVRGVKMSPKSKAIIAFDDFEASNVAQNAVQRYSFRNRSRQDQYDPFGHPQLNCELLAYDPQAGLYCFQTSGTYDSLFNTAKELDVAFPQVQPTPMILQPMTYNTKGSKTQEPWPEHYYKLSQAANSPELAPVMAAFNAFLAENAENAELNAAITAWSKQTLTQEQFDALVSIGEIRG